MRKLIVLMSLLVAGAAQANDWTGYCDEDCREHNAGYTWAMEHAMRNPRACPRGLSMHFYRGCQAYAIERRTER